MKPIASIVACMVASAIAAATNPVAAAPPPAIVAVEQAVEASSDELTLPAGGIGTVSFPGCSACKPPLLLATTSTQWFIGTQRVGFADVRNALGARRRSGVLVLYRHGTSEITRMIVHAGTR